MSIQTHDRRHQWERLVSMPAIRRKESAVGTFEEPEIKKLLLQLRRDVVHMAERSAHVAPALSCVDILGVLYFYVLNVSPSNSSALDRDRFILSKGHAAMALYAVLARAGLINESETGDYCQVGSYLMEHPPAGKIPAIEFATGSLGHGLPVAVGMAKGLELKGLKARVFVLLGDGECDEGTVWESAAVASGQRLDNLIAVVDQNGWQACSRCCEVSGEINLGDRWASFGWSVDSADGHDPEQLKRCLSRRNDPGRPRVVICHTVKGKGINFMENNLEWHYRPVRGDEKEQALRELSDA